MLKPSHNKTYRIVVMALCIYATLILLGGFHNLWFDLNDRGHVPALSFFLDLLMLAYLPAVLTGIYRPRPASIALLSAGALAMLFLILALIYRPPYSSANVLYAAMVLVAIPVLLAGAFYRRCGHWL